MEAVDVNLWAVLAAAVVYFVLGALWYSPLLFAAPWMAETGKNQDDMNKSGDYSVFIVTFLLLLLLSYVLAHMLAYTGSDTVSAAFVTGVWLWLGFIATTMTINSMYAGRTRKLTVIDAGYHLIGIVVAAVVITLVA